VLLWKAVVLEAPLLPSDAAELWQVEVSVAIRGEGEAGGVRLQLPNSRRGQRIFSEYFQGDGLELSTRRRKGAREALWSGPVDGLHRLTYRFRARRFSERVELPLGTPDPAFLERSAPDGAGSELVESLFADLGLPPRDDFAGRVRSLYAFASHEVRLSPTGADDPILALSQREANATGKEALLALLLERAGAWARVVEGIELLEGRPRPRVWTEVWTGDGWFPMSASQDFFGDTPPRVLALSSSGAPLVEATGGVVSMAHFFRAIRIPLTEAELAALAIPSDPWWARLSLYRLPVSTQSALRLLLLLPLGALAIALLRNVIGLPGYGTFMPMLIALALRGTGLAVGLALITLVLLAGIAARMSLERLHLLLIPRLGIILSTVILAVAALALAGRGFEHADFYAGGLFPIVILTMLVERFSIRASEEGLRTASLYAAYSVAMAVALYPIFQSEVAEHLMFSFPELLFVVMGGLVWTGGYTGYRLSDWIRFGLLAHEEEASR
jgi:hypothetical protein